MKPEIVFLILAVIGIVLFWIGCATRPPRYPRPYIVEAESGGWVIAIDAGNGEPIFRAEGYKDAASALMDYAFKRDRIGDAFVPYIAAGCDGRFVWTFTGWQSEQSFATHTAARENWLDCKNAILDCSNPEVIRGLKL